MVVANLLGNLTALDKAKSSLVTPNAKTCYELPPLVKNSFVQSIFCCYTRR